MDQSSLVECPERVRLSRDVAVAVQAVYQATGGDRTALGYGVTLSETRKAERSAIRALDEHRKAHGC